MKNNPHSYPPIGQTWIFDIGVAQIEHRFESERAVHYKILSGSHRLGEEESVSIEVDPIAPNVFLVSWQENDGSIVVHVEDYERRIFHACVTLPDRRFMRLKGTMWPVGEP